MITCSSASLIKLCVVFVLNISLFTTGTAPPLLSSNKRPTTSPQGDESAIKTSSTTEWSTTIGSYASRTESPPPLRVPSSTTVSSPTSHVNVTGGRRPSSEIKPTTTTFSTIKLSTLSSSLSSTGGGRSRRVAENLGGSTTSSSLSKKFEDLLPFSTSPPPPTHSRLPHSSKKSDQPIIVEAVKSSKISEVSDIIGATRGRSSDGESERASTNYRVTSSSSSSSHSVLVDYVGELSPRVTYSTSSSKLETADGEQSHEGGEEEILSATMTTTAAAATTTSTTTSPTSSLSSPEMLTSTKMGDFLSTKRSQKDDNTISTATFSTGNAIITTETETGGSSGGGMEDLFSEDQMMMMEFNDDAYSAVDEDDETFSIGIMFDKDYSPEEIAEYIFLTGDERGVASTINDLINDGLMLSRTETIKFLESVKAHLTDLRSRYQEFLIVSEDAEDSGGGESPSVGVTGGDDNNGESGDSVTSSTTNIPT
ncbi:uncharacterized serine-rich protein C215.13 isoform X1 [Folsomia candida]|nr:uncharacterized serine-rich protein C215.13 isoform X1 [Folsomia candida]